MAAHPRTFGKYLLDEEIARGGMSRVFLARLRGLGGFEKRLVVKQVLPDLARDPRFVGMFVQEAKTVVQMSHPHIVPVYELGVVDGTYFLAMEYVEGATLASILKHGPLGPALVAHLGAQICDALEYAHGRFGIVHRDVTPRNVIVDATGHARLLDFGIATPAEEVDGEVFGTPGYLPPELLRGEAVGSAGDQFALAAVLYEAISGRRAFPGRKVDEIREALLIGIGPRFEAGDAVPQAIANAVERGLARDPADRFPSLDAMGRTLRSWLASAHPEGVGPELGERSEEAHALRRMRPRSEPAPPVGRGDPSESVRTLATSHLLDKLLDPSEARRTSPSDPLLEPAPSPTAAVTSLEPDVESGPTEAIPRRRGSSQSSPGRESVRPADEDAGTVALPKPASDPERPSVRPPGPPPAKRWPWIVGAASAALATLAVILLRQPAPPVPAEEPTPEVAAAPIEEAPPEVAAPEQPEPPPAPIEEAPPVPAAEPTPVARTPLSVNATPWAEIRLDGRSLGNTPQRRLTVRPGVHTLELVCPPLGRRATTQIEARGRPIVVVANLSTDPPTIRVR